MKKFFYTDGIEKFGPFSKEELKEKVFSRDTKVWYFGLSDWTQISNIDELKEITNSLPPPLKIEKLVSKEVDKKTIEILNNNTTKKKSRINSKSPIIILIALVFSILVFFYFYWNEKTDKDLYNQIVASSFETEEDFNFYIDKFYRDLEAYGIYPKKASKIVIKFAKLDQITDATHIHGVSYGRNDDDRIEIYINPSTWKSFNKPKKYYLIYHELAHDVLNLKDLNSSVNNEGKLMYPAISTYENINMDDFIEASHALFEEVSKKKYSD